MDSTGSKIVVVLAKAYKSYFNKLSSNFKELGSFTASEFGALEYLYHCKKPVSSMLLSDKILLTTSTTTYTITKLIKRNLIQKKENEFDKRFIEITLTDKGKKLMDKIFPIHQQFVESINPLTENEAQQLISLLKKLGKGK